MPISETKIWNKFRQLIRQAYYSLVSDDTSEFPQGQVTSNGKATNIVRMSVYGVFGNAPKDSHVLMFQNQGQESTKFGIFNDFLRRKKTEGEGECGLFNTLTGAIVYMKEDGSIAIESATSIDGKAPVVNIDADTEVNINAPTINANGTTINVIGTSEVNVNAPTVNVDATTVEVNATTAEINADTVDVNADNANVTASVKATVDAPDIELGTGIFRKLLNLLAMIVFNTHTHISGFAGFPTTVPTQQMVEDTDTTSETKAA